MTQTVTCQLRDGRNADQRDEMELWSPVLDTTNRRLDPLWIYRGRYGRSSCCRGARLLFLRARKCCIEVSDHHMMRDVLAASRYPVEYR